MKLFRKLGQSLVVQIPLCVALLLLFGCTPEPSLEVAGKFSGRDLMRGIFLADGPVAKLIPEIAQNFDLESFITDPDDLTTIRTLQERLLDDIEAQNPGIFQSFKLGIESGNHLTIQNTLEEYGNLVLQTIMDLEPELARVLSDNQEFFETVAVEVEDIPLAEQPAKVMELLTSQHVGSKLLMEQGGISERGQCLFVVLVVGAVVAVVGAAAVLLYVVEAAAVLYDIGVSSSDGPAGPLPSGEQKNSIFQEQLINSIALKLR